MSAFSESIEALYSAFRDVPKPRAIEGCPCCIDKEQICTLLSKPLRELSGGDLASYSSSALLTVGHEADYLYFLPRILEVGCGGGGWYPDIEVTGRAIGQTRPDDWPEQRREAVLTVFRAAVQNAIDEEEGWAIDEFICAIGRASLPVGPYLELVQQSPKAVVAYYERNSRALMKNKLGNAFWERSDPGYEQVVVWFKSGPISEVIAESYGLKPN